MKQSLKEAANVLARGRSRAFISRVAWLDLEQLVSSAFSEISENGTETAELGNLYLTKNRDYPPFDKSHFNAFNVTNQIQVHAGWRQLHVCHAITENMEARAEWLAESGATLWFSQDATGSVMVFVAPYKSKAMTMNEDNIILARYKCATGVSSRNVRRHFSTYFRYCSVTSVHGDLGAAGYIFRLRLKYGDFRYSSQMRASVFRFLEPLLAVVGIVATLYAGNKLFS
jgi:hypothetical protein